MVKPGRRRRSWSAHPGVAGLALANAGCLVAAGGGAAGGVAGYVYYKGNVSRTYLANVDDVRAATCTALAELQMPFAEGRGESPTAPGWRAVPARSTIVLVARRARQSGAGRRAGDRSGRARGDLRRPRVERAHPRPDRLAPAAGAASAGAVPTSAAPAGAPNRAAPAGQVGTSLVQLSSCLPLPPPSRQLGRQLPAKCKCRYNKE